MGGFLKGIGKGLADVVVKPVSGVFQVAGLATGAVKSGIAGAHPQEAAATAARAPAATASEGGSASRGGSADDGAAITCRQLIVMGGMDLTAEDALPRSVTNHCDCTHWYQSL